MHRAVYALPTALLACLAVASSAPAMTLVDPTGTPVGGQAKTWADRALAPLPPALVILHATACPDDPESGACSLPPEIWGVQSRMDLYHELGHVFDDQVLNAVSRRAVVVALGEQGRPWHIDEREDARNPSVELAAEAYAWCAQRGPRLTRPVADAAYHYNPGPRRHQRVCQVFRRAAAGFYGAAQ